MTETTGTSQSVIEDPSPVHVRKKRFATSQPSVARPEVVTFDPVAASGWGILHGVCVDGTGLTNMWHDELEQEANTREFLDELYTLAQLGTIPHAMDRAVEFVNLLLHGGRFSACDDLIARLDQTRIPSSVRSAFLMITRPAKGKLANRQKMYDTAFQLLAKEKNEVTAKRMLKNLA